jgi:septum formation protein
MDALAGTLPPPVPLPRRLILASASRGRRQLLAAAGYTFHVHPADLDEPPDAPHGDCQRYVAELAWAKAHAVAPHYDAAVILAADTVAWIDGRVIGKPADESDARHILRTLAGRTHQLWTGVCLWLRPEDLQLAWQEVSLVALRPLDEAQIDHYLRSRLWQNCSGAYALQLPHDPDLTVLRGSASNVIGLPLESLHRAFQLLARLHPLLADFPADASRPPELPQSAPEKPPRPPQR